MTVYDDLKVIKGYKKHTGTYGIEIETETYDPYMVPTFKFWKHDEDHSLRNFGIEYMLKAPLAWEDEVNDALKEFEVGTVGIPFNKNSTSTSVHVHMNMLNEEWITVANIFTVYALVENLLIRWSGPARRSNLFCLPICDAEEQYKDIINLLSYIKLGKFSSLWNFEEKTNKYSALNFVPLTIHGSIEFRSFRGDPTRECIRTWIGFLNCILGYARKGGLTPNKIIDYYRMDKLDLVREIFGIERTNLLFDEAIKQGDDPIKLISQNFWYAASIALWNKDWSSFGVIEKAKPLIDKAFDKFCIETFGRPHDLLSPEEQDIIKIIYQNNGGKLGAAKAQLGGQWNINPNAFVNPPPLADFIGGANDLLVGLADEPEFHPEPWNGDDE